MAVWRVRVARASQQDLSTILVWTEQHFGTRQAHTYARTLALALRALTDGPEIAGVKPRDDILPGVLVLHVARQRRKGRHLIVFRLGRKHIIEVLRVLHDSMDLARHLEPPPTTSRTPPRPAAAS